MTKILIVLCGVIDVISILMSDQDFFEIYLANRKNARNASDSSLKLISYSPILLEMFCIQCYTGQKKGTLIESLRCFIECKTSQARSANMKYVLVMNPKNFLRSFDW